VLKHSTDESLFGGKKTMNAIRNSVKTKTEKHIVAQLLFFKNVTFRPLQLKVYICAQCQNKLRRFRNCSFVLLSNTNCK